MAKRKLDIDSLPSNDVLSSDREVSKVVKGRVKSRNAGGLANDVRNIGNSLFSEIILPAIKSMVMDFVNSGLNMIMFQQDEPFSLGRHKSYHKAYDNRRSRGRMNSKRRGMRSSEPLFEDIFFDDRNDARLVLGKMMELLSEFGWVTIGDLYSLVGMPFAHNRCLG